jgi:hypothetical protein
MTKQYFQHDYEARNSLQVKALIKEHGAAGYGIFWAVVEVLHEKKNKLPLKEYVYSGIADQMKVDGEKVETVIRFCIEKCELFSEKKGFLSSTRVKRNIIKRLDISKTRAKSGKHGANVKQNLAKERKGKESKGKEIKESEYNAREDLSKSNLFRNPRIPTKDEVIQTFSSNGGTPEMATTFFQKHDGTGWFLNGSPITNYVSLAQNFIRNWNEKDKKKIAEGPESTGGPKLQML